MLRGAVALLLVSAAAQAGSFNPVDWLTQKAVEDAAGKAVKDAVTGKAKSGLVARGGDTEARLAGASSVSGKDYLALPLTGAYRFAVPKGVPMEALPVGPRGGYVHRFFRVCATGFRLRMRPRHGLAWPSARQR